MGLKPQLIASVIHSVSGVWCGILALLLSLSILPTVVHAQLTNQPGSTAAAGPANAVSDEIRNTALGQMREGNLEQLLKVLEVPAEGAVTISLLEVDSLAPICAGLNRLLAPLDDEDRFELLYRWSLAGQSPKRIRRLTALVPTFAPPAEFARALGERPRDNSFPIASIGAVRGIFSTEWSLVIAAKNSGHLKRLTTELATLVDQKVAGADRLLILARIADDRGDMASVARELSERIGQLKSAPNPTTIDQADVVLAVSAMHQRKLGSTAEELLGALIASTHGRPAPAVRPFLRQAHATASLLARTDTATTDLPRILAPGLKYWVPVVRDASEAKSPGRSDPAWLVHEGQILHLSGSLDNTLLLRYPLTGDFRFQFETQLDDQFETNGAVCYGGLRFQAEGSSGPLHVLDAVGNRIADRAWPVAYPSATPAFNRLSLTSTPDSATMSMNLHPMWVESKGLLAGPWLGLASRGDTRPLFRNFRMTGQPTIPRSVRIADGELLRNWQPRAWAKNAAVIAGLESGWSVAEGVIQAPRDQVDQAPVTASASDHLAQSLLSYDRPLLSGESVNYEFFYEPGAYEIHPALGRVGFLLQSDGVRIHWMTAGDDWTSLAATNTIVEPLCRRGPRPLPLKASDWNRLSMKRTDQTVTLALNDVVIYERPIDWDGDHRFGLYRHGTTAAAKVRNVELTGDWPETLPLEFLSNPTATTGEPLTIPQRHCLTGLFQEEFLADNIVAVRRQALAMPVADRFEFLSRWILPGADHPGFRLTGDFTATQPAHAAPVPGIDHPELGGQIVSPVFDWLDAAKELGKLRDCLQVVETAVSPDTEAQKRAQISLRLLLHLELSDQPAASERFAELYELLRLPTSDEQWAELLVIDRSTRKFAANEAVAKFLADVRTLKAQQSRSSRSSLWQAQMSSRLARTQAASGAVALAESQTPALQDWIPVSAATATTRGQGYPVARWQRSVHKIVKGDAHADDFLFYRLPLSGNYEVECDVIDATQVMIGGSYIGARRDQRALDLGTFRAATAAEPVEPPFSTFWPTVHFRAVIRDGTRSVSINGRPVKSGKLSDDTDPWLAIRTAGSSHGGVQNLRISGQPRVLDAVPLSNSRELTGWISYHGEPVSHATSGWTYFADPESSGWIVGHPQPAVAGMAIESLLRYQRPLVEDGSLEYEFFYEPDAFETHPALDRRAFILHPSGVREHWIGDGRYERTDLEPNHQIDNPASRRGPAALPLKARAWNLLRLSLRGSAVTLELNGQLIYERNLEPTNQRTLGLFHFLDNSAVRVRNAVLRGDWQKAVPPVTDQELADDTVDKLNADLAGLRAEFSHDFQKDGIPEQYFKAPAPNATLRVIPGPQGVQASQRAAGPHTGFNIYPRFTLSGDFDIVVHFTGLRIEGSGDAGIMLNATLEEEQRHEYRALRMKTTAGNQDLHSSVSLVRPDGGRTYVGDSKSFEALSGRIRLARRGQRVYYLFAENDSEHYFIFGSEPSSNADTQVDGIFLHSFCNGVSISQVTWTKLVLRAERIAQSR